MVKNSFISLEPNSKARVDAVNTIKYTLFLDYKLPDLSSSDLDILNTDRPLKLLMEACRKCCAGLFSNDSLSANYEYNFFGKSLDPYMDSSPKSIEAKDNIDTSDFSKMILQHCLLSSYHAILTNYCNIENETYKAYTIENILQNNDKNKSNSQKSSEASDFRKKLETHFRALPFLKNLFKVEGEEAYYSQFSGLLYKICSIGAPSWKNFITYKSINSYLYWLKELPDEMQKNNENYNYTDIIYHEYIIERIFNFNLITCLLQNIIKIKNMNYNKNILKILSFCQLLPNTINRQYFVQYAFKQFEIQPESSLDFWREQNRGTCIMSFAKGIETGFQISTWMQQFKYFCKYMATFVIPVYEWCFINMLMEVIEKDDNNDHKENLKKAIYYLGKQIEEFTPLKTAPGNIVTNIPEDEFMFFTKLFSPKENDIELNLKLLNPDFFISPGNTNLDFSDFHRQYYTNLIKDKYLIDNHPGQHKNSYDH